jgi:hypothetical protein
MAFHLTFRWGSTESNVGVDRMVAALSELDVNDPEHPDVSLTHESEWCLGVYEGGLLVWENLESGAPRHMKAVPREKVLRLWMALSRGELSLIEGEPWLPGYG